MKKYMLIGAACALFAGSAMAQSTTVTEHADGSTTTTTRETVVKKDNSGTATGAVGGGGAGGGGAGPIGAVVGGVAGAAVGHSVAPPTEVRTYVTRQQTAPVAYQGQIEVGKPIEGSVTWLEVPSYPKYHWAYLNSQRVVVDDNHNVVAVYAN
ncbi:MAG: DUF1236 domain-containing protein [Caulobacteraceae bacterium]